MYLYGKNSVFERLKKNPQTIKKIFLQSGFKSPDIEKLIKSNKIVTAEVSKSQLYKIKRADALGGVVAKVNDFEYSDFNDLLDELKKTNGNIIFLDRIFDPQNLGAIMRTAACFGKFGVVIPKHKACQVTETVLHVAQGAENYIQVASVTNLSNALIEIKKEGFWVVGAVVGNGEDLRGASMPNPTALVLGSEGQGIRYGVDKHLDFKVSIPMAGSDLSFNVTAACAILLYKLSENVYKNK